MFVLCVAQLPDFATAARSGTAAAGLSKSRKEKDKARRAADWSIDKTPTKKGKGAGKGPGKGKGSPPEKVYNFEYGAGSLKTPNGLERMVGGNPAGSPCNRLFGPEKCCPYAACSFSHEKKK